MPEKTGSLLDRMKKMPLWQWGGCFIFGAMFTNLAFELTLQAGDVGRAEERAMRMGAAGAGVLLMVLGIVLIILHFTRKKRSD